MVDILQTQVDQRDKRLSLPDAGTLTFHGITELLYQDLPSESSRRVYRYTFQQWEQFATQNNLDFMDLYSEHIKSFLFSRSLSHSTRVSRKSHMQRLLRMVSYLDPTFGIQYILLRDLNIRRTSRDNAPRRQPRLLSGDECRQLLAIWKHDETHKGIRNYAVICLLLYTAIRNAELVALRWEDLDRDAQTLKIYRGGKAQRRGDLNLGLSSEALYALRRLHNTQRSVVADQDVPYERMFPALSTGKDARFKPSKRVRTSTQTIRNIVAQTGEMAGLGRLSSRDIRYTSSIVYPRMGAAVAGDSSAADG